MSKNTCRILCGDREIYSSDRRGIAPLIELIESGKEVKGCTAYDKIVGKAAALLYALMGINKVHAEVISVTAIELFRKYRIDFSYITLTERIINRNGDDVCPMEKTVEDIFEPQEAFKSLKAKIKEMQTR